MMASEMWMLYLQLNPMLGTASVPNVNTVEMVALSAKRSDQLNQGMFIAVILKLLDNNMQELHLYTFMGICAC